MNLGISCFDCDERFTDLHAAWLHRQQHMRTVATQYEETQTLQIEELKVELDESTNWADVAGIESTSVEFETSVVEQPVTVYTVRLRFLNISDFFHCHEYSFQMSEQEEVLVEETTAPKEVITVQPASTPPKRKTPTPKRPAGGTSNVTVVCVECKKTVSKRVRCDSFNVAFSASECYFLNLFLHWTLPCTTQVVQHSHGLSRKAASV